LASALISDTGEFAGTLTATIENKQFAITICMR
jgi:hypothetical protein